MQNYCLRFGSRNPAKIRVRQVFLRNLASHILSGLGLIGFRAMGLRAAVWNGRGT